MKNSLYLLLILITFLLGCSRTPQTKSIKTEESNATTLKENISYVSAKILEINKQSDTLYNLRLQILQSSADESLPNFAQVGEEILTKPRFILDENGSINFDDVRNQNLLELSKLKSGDVVNLVLTRTLNEGWLIINFQK